jgi:allantoate deiminase
MKTPGTELQLARQVMERVNALGSISEEKGKLTRTFCSPAMRRANDVVAGWMKQAGMSVSEDAVGNVIGRYEAAGERAKILLLGSHLDTVRDAGKFDGALGVLIAIACVEYLRAAKASLPFNVQVIGFSDEEGVRYQSTYLGSKAVAGTFDLRHLQRCDDAGVKMADAISRFGGDSGSVDRARLDPAKLLAYAEVHIEQGPLLEEKKLPVGVVSGIAGQTRAEVTFRGVAGHAGTVPISLRKDALCGASEFVLAVEALAEKTEQLVATVGRAVVVPGASNVIPGEVRLTLDVRHVEDALRNKAFEQLQKQAQEIARERGLSVQVQTIQETGAVRCDPALMELMRQAVQGRGSEPLVLASGAGHDAAILGAITRVAMLFVRCRGGISHHPDEFASVDDIAVALGVLYDFVLRLAKGS